ncbi:LamG-like jellyroll fold domain-containing protein [Bizionia hallyeonensis]|uniref:LamG-like jellyroll fold domain-containing protein n=1 Tax=Bizionia hallyeonensis TaxID=1123757 RepID=A0ABW0C7Q6_9FLAO
MKKITFYSLLLIVITFSVQGFSKPISSDYFSANINQGTFFSNPLNDYVSLRPDFEESFTESSTSRAITSCPTDFSVNVDPGTCGAVVTYTMPTTDLIGGSMVLTSALGIGDTFPDGPTTVTYEERDSGNTATGQICNFVVTVLDNEAPVLTPGIDRNVNLDASCEITIPNVLGTATDNCDVASITQNPIAGFVISAVHNQTINVTVTATDDSGNTDVETVVLTAIDVINPVTPTLADLTGECSVTATAPTTTDACSGTITGTTTDPLTYNTQGTYTIVWNFDDGNGNDINVNQTVIVDDTQNPTVSNPAPINVQCTSNVPIADILVVTDEADNCSTPVVTFVGDVSDGNSNPEVITRTYSVTDAAGNSINVEQTITINDTQNPTASNPAPINVQCASGVPIADILVVTDEADNCSTPIVAFVGDVSDGNSNPEVITRTYSVTDAAGNSINVEQTITINDSIDPTPDNATLSDIPAQCEVTTLTAPTATDNCGGTVTVTNDATLPISTQGTTVVTWTYDDGNGNTSTQTQNVIIDDITAPTPVVATLADVTAQCEVTTLTAPTATDNCGGTVTVTNDATLPISTQGTTVVTWTYDDGNGNTSTQTQNVVIADITAPTPDVATLGDVTAECEVTTLTAPTATDNCGGTVTVTNDATLPISTQGTIVVTWTYDDGNGNTSTQTQNVIIDDITAPTPDVTTLANVTAECEVTTLTAPTATDNCGGTVTVTNDATLPISTQGTTVVTWTYDDGNGNTSTQTQNVIIDDITAPTPDVTTLANVTAECEVTTLADPTATDNCGGTVTVTNDATLPISTQGTTVVTWTYDDGNGNTSTQTQNVIIDDITAPTPVVATLADVTAQCEVTTLTAPTATDNCGGTVTVTNDATLPISTQGTTVVTWTYDDGNGNTSTQTQNVIIDDITAPTPDVATLANVTAQCEVTTLTAPTATDNCGGTVTVTNDATLPISTQGTTVVTWTYDDGNGNTSTQTQNVVIDDVTAPIADIATLANVTAECEVATLTAPTATDNCGGTVTVTNDASLPITTQDTTVVTWTYDDGNGNTSTQTQNVIIDDITAPTPDIATLANVTAQCEVTTLTAPTATDNCGGTVTVTNDATLPISTQGTTVVTWTYDDGNGNASTQTQNVVILDTTAPNAVCQNFTVTLDEFGNATISETDIDNGSTDNCGVQSISLNNTIFDCSNLGANTVTLTVRDLSGNVSTCTATVTVLDPAANADVHIINTIANNDSPIAICDGENITFNADTTTDSGASPIYNWFIDGTSFGTNNPTFTPFTPLPVGTHTIYVEMQSSLSACIAPVPSNTITVTVNAAPAVTSPAQICIGDTGNLTPNSGGTWTSSNTSIATVTNAGVITPAAPGNVTFTFTSSATTCSSTTNNLTINALPIISNLPSNSDICVNETHTLYPTSGGIWTSSNNGIATISNAGVITGVNPGNATFTYTNTATGCSATSASIEVLDIPVITSVTASNNPVCAGDASILTANVLGAGGNNATLVNYNFNSGSSYLNSSIVDGNEASGITSNINGTIDFNRPNNQGEPTTPTAFTPNTTAGGALRQIDDWEDGGGWGGSDDAGNWRFNLGGTSLPTYQDFRVYFQASRATGLGGYKNILIDFRSPNINGGNWVNGHRTLPLPEGNSNWVDINFPLPAGVNNPNNLEIRLRVNDASTFNYICGWGSCITWAEREPHVLIDNFQVQATTSGSNFEYAWIANTGANAGLPAGAGTASSTNNEITVNPQVNTIYTVIVTNSDGCPATQTVPVNVFAVPSLSVLADYCPAPPNNNFVQLVADGLGFVSYEWNTGETTPSIFVDIAGTYQVIGTTINGCTVSATINVATELVVNGDFQQGNIGFTSDYTYHADVAGNNELVDDTGTNGYSITTNGQNVHPNFWGFDNTTGAGNFMAVNGHGSGLIVWQQANVTVLPSTTYYFSAYGMSLNDQWRSSRRARLTFNVGGINVGTTPTLPNRPDNNNPGSDNWTRFYGTYTTGPAETSVDIEIRNLNNSASGNDFGIDDISFATLSTFIRLTTPAGTDNQTVCQDSPITEITYDIGGGLTPPNITGLPAGLTTTFDGLEYTIAGTPTAFGTFNYTITTTSSCDVKSATGTITVNEAPIATINTTPITVCQSSSSILLDVSLTGGATVGDSGSGWSTSGTGTFDDNFSLTPTYTFGAGETGTITLTFTTNTPAGPCDEATTNIDIDITPYIIATAGPDQSTSNCANATVTLAANNSAGNWTASPNTGFFSDPTAYNSTFTGESGETYILTWTATNVSPCGDTTDAVEITIPNCGTNLVFDGTDDNISFATNYGLNSGSFSVEAWVKPNTVTGTQTIVSKRNGNNLNSGYDLSLINNRLYFRWNSSQIFATQTMNNTKWYHVAVTYDGNYTMYIDGFEVRSATAGASPTGNTNKALIGAMDRTNMSPTNHFGGGIDEVRIWNTAISQTQIREMMNQEIQANGANVSGGVVPINISGGLQWNNLIGYYQMNTGSQTSVLNGAIENIATSAMDGNLNGMTMNQNETAPIPYISGTNNNWDNQNTWINGAVQQIPNSNVNSINGQRQTWNIVRTASNVTSGNRPTTVLGLLVDSNRYSITNEQSLRVTNYLKIDGVLDLEGESQLLQNMNSIVDYNGTGYMERDQQGTSNRFNYNYWGSPVSTDGVLGARTYTLSGIISNAGWTSGNNGSLSPLTLSSRWIYSFSEGLQDTYSEWEYKGNAGDFEVGLGFTMKGPGPASPVDTQNYIFRGQPNNGTITAKVSSTSGINQTLVGNPYASAIDADMFIRDNIPGGNAGTSGSIDGSLYLWKQSTTNNSHITANYQGGYATYNLSGGNPAVSSPGINGVGDANLAIPKRYIPVAQGFFVTAAASSDQVTNDVVFKNSQRIFIKESSGNSEFFRGTNNSEINRENEEVTNDIQRIRVQFTTPENAIRPLLLAFTPENLASEGFDYGYDALNTDDNPSDMSFQIEDGKYIIQGVGEFNAENMYPVTIDMGMTGNAEIELTDLENFDADPDVFVYDALLGTYTRINVTPYQTNLDAGTHEGRFYIVFQEDNVLSTETDEFPHVIVNYLNSTNQIYIKVPYSMDIKQVYLVNMLGQTIKSWNSTNAPLSQECKIPVRQLSEGNYIIKVQTTDNQTINKKVIVKMQ